MDGKLAGNLNHRPCVVERTTGASKWQECGSSSAERMTGTTRLKTQGRRCRTWPWSFKADRAVREKEGIKDAAAM